MKVGVNRFSLSTHEKTFAGSALTKAKYPNSSCQQTRFWLTKSEIVKVRVKAIRRGIWFHVLTKAERAYIGLIIEVVDRVRSHFLAAVLTTIIEKLSNALQSRVVLNVIKIGYCLAQKLSRIAQNWGNASASQWVKNRGFVQYLAVSYINTPAAAKFYLRV